jgi:hypothetical protein
MGVTNGMQNITRSPVRTGAFRNDKAWRRNRVKPILYI